MNHKTQIELRCVWPDYQPIRAAVDINSLIIQHVDALKEQFENFGISRILLINDVVYPFNNIARDVLKFDTAEIKKLCEVKRAELYRLTVEMAKQLTIDPATPSQAVQWNNDIYVLMSTRAMVLKPSLLQPDYLLKNVPTLSDYY